MAVLLHSICCSLLLCVAGNPIAATPADLIAAQGPEDWPTFRHDASRSGRIESTLPLHDFVAEWQHTFGAPHPAWPGPAKWDAFAALPGLKSMRDYDSAYHVIAVGDSIYFSSNRNCGVFSLDARNGGINWRFATKVPVRIAPTFDDGRIYFGDDSGTAYCLNAETGGVIWTFSPHAEERLVIHEGKFISFFPIRTGILIRDGQAYFGASFLPWKPSFLYSVNAKTGKLSGTKSFAKELGEGWTLEGAMLASESSLVMPQGRVAPLLFSREDGSPQGTLEGGGGSFCLLTDDDRVLHGPGNKTGWITDSDANSRAKVASYEKGNSIVVEGDTAYLLGERALTAFDRSSQAVIWSREIDTPFTLIQAGPHLIAGGDGIVRVFEASTGDEVWAVTVPGRALGLAVSQTRLFVSTDVGAICGFMEPVKATMISAQGPSPLMGFHGSPYHDYSANPLPPSTSAKLATPMPIQKKSERGLLDRWVFQSDTQAQVPLADDDPRTTPCFPNLASRSLASWPRGGVQLHADGGFHYLELNGSKGDLEIATLDGGELQPSNRSSKSSGSMHLPKRNMTVEAWVRVDHAGEWGGVIGAAQDNGNYERGWILGFRKNRFGFALKAENGSDRLTWLLAPSSYQVGSWHHIAGSYDGKSMRLFVDGEPVSESQAQQNDIHYPEEGWYHLGAYRDKDEYFRMKGALHEVRLYDRTLKPADLQKHFKLKADLIPRPRIIAPPRALPTVDLELATEPWIRLPNEDHYAKVSWSTSTEIETEIEFVSARNVPGPDGKFPSKPVGGWKQDPELAWKVSLASDAMPQYHSGSNSDISESHLLPSERLRHRVMISGLLPDSVHHFRVIHREGKRIRRSRIYELDTHFSAPRNSGKRSSNFFWSFVELRAILDEISSLAPLIVMVAAGPNPEDSIAINSALGQRTLGDLRLAFQGCWLGASIHTLTPGELDLLPPACADMVFVALRTPSTDESLSKGKTFSESVQRIVAPGGVVVSSEEIPWQPGDDFTAETFEAAYPDSSIPYFAHRRHALPGAGEWSHLYGRPDNSAFGGESLAGSSTVGELETQWVGRPGPRYQTDRQNRRPAPLAINGRLFLQGQDRIIGMNSFNGQILWAWELPGLNRFNMPRDCSNWCADADAVYVAMSGNCYQLDAASGNIQQVHSVVSDDANSAGSSNASEEAGEAWNWGFVARENGLLIGSEVRPGNTFTEWWGGANWYDAREGSATAKVCSDALFARNAASGEHQWRYESGLILNTTITIADDRIYFLENRTAELHAGESRRFAGEALFQNLHMVALDLATGDVIWQREAKPLPGDVATYLAESEGRLILVTSHRNPSVGKPGGEFAIYSFDAKDGSSQWRRKFSWEVDHHGKSLSRPTIVGGHIYLRPLVLELKSGEVVRQHFPEGHQCGTYTATTEALFLRSGNMAAWSRKDWTASRWERLRPDCWISTIPANGMLLAPEGGGGCSCGSWIETSAGFMPKSVDSN